MVNYGACTSKILFRARDPKGFPPQASLREKPLGSERSEGYTHFSRFVLCGARNWYTLIYPWHGSNRATVSDHFVGFMLCSEWVGNTWIEASSCTADLTPTGLSTLSGFSSLPFPPTTWLLHRPPKACRQRCPKITHRVISLRSALARILIVCLGVVA